MVVVCDSSIRCLSGLTSMYRGRAGIRGSGELKLGMKGKSAIIKVKILQ